MFIGIDIGSSSVKTSLFNGHNFHVVRSAYAGGIDPNVQPADLVSTTVSAACRQLLSETHVAPAQIQGIGLSGHGPSLVFIDDRGKTASPLVTWQDNRAIDEALALRQRIPGFSKDGSSYEAKLQWFHTHLPQVFSPGYTALYPKDYILYLLCGERVVDTSTASTFAFFNRETHGWNQSLVDFPCSVLPPVIDSWVCAGHTSTMFSRSCALPDGIPVYPGGIDAYCGAVGAGVTTSDTIVEETGTSTCVSRCFPGANGGDLHVIPDFSLTMKVISSTGRSFQWYMDLLGITDLKELLLEVDPEDLVPILFLPYLSGERSPIWDEKALGTFVGVRGTTSKVDLLRAIMQGTAFAIYQNIRLLEMPDQAVSAVHAIGGSARDGKWQQMKANITGIPYRQMKLVDGAAIGAALIAAIGDGALKASDIPALIEIERDFEPSRAAHERYRGLFEEYAALYGKLASVFHTLYQP